MANKGMEKPKLFLALTPFPQREGVGSTFQFQEVVYIQLFVLSLKYLIKQKYMFPTTKNLLAFEKTDNIFARIKYYS